MTDLVHPLHPVPVVRLIVPNDRDEVLILRRAPGETGAGGWSLPGGKVDYGEKVEDAAARELREETALECVESTFLFPQDGLPLEPGAMHCVNLYFHCTVTGSLELGSDSTEHTWISPPQLGRYEILFGNALALRRYWSP